MSERDDLVPVGFRLPAEMIDRIDAYSRQVEQRVPGVRLTRSNAIRALIELALKAEGFEPKPKRGK